MVRVLRYLKADTWIQRFSRKNKIVNKTVRSLQYDDLFALKRLKIDKKNFDSIDFISFLNNMIPNWKAICPDKYFKKFLEFYISYVLLQPDEKDVFLDAAGGMDTYVSSLLCKKKYVSDVKISDHFKEKYGNYGIDFIEGTVANIPLAAGSVSKISCHHSIEHFQAEADKEFIDEVQRLLAPGGACCIVPIFISDKMFEIVNKDRPSLSFDCSAKKIIDPSATFTGGQSCGDYARIYNLDSFQERIIDRINTSLFKISLFQFSMDGTNIPDLKLKYNKSVARVNYPYRALLLERLRSPRVST